MASNRTLRMGMVGGGPGSFIGPVHRMAAELDGQIRLVAGVFSQSTEKCDLAAIGYGIDPGRSYYTIDEMLKRESSRPDGIDFLSIVTPNHLHFPMAKAAIEAGLPVISDKPATATPEEAVALQACVKANAGLYALTYTYSGYPLVRAAKGICGRGDLGKIRKVLIEYSQGWLSEPLGVSGQKQAAWREDPRKAGIGGAISDIGVHAFHLVEFVTGLRVDSVCAQLSTIVPGRVLDDDCNILLRMENGATGVLTVSQIAAGDRNGLRLRIYGETGSLDWCQEDPNKLYLHSLHGPSQVLHASGDYLDPKIREMFRLPGGHPEGLIEALANVYLDFAHAVQSKIVAGSYDPAGWMVGIDDGVRSLQFVNQVIASNQVGWQSILRNRHNSGSDSGL